MTPNLLIGLRIMSTKIRLLAISTVALVVSGCGGGGGSSSLTQITFSDVNSVTTPSQVNLEGISTDYNYQASDSAVTSVTDNGIDTSASAALTYRSDNTIRIATLNTDNSSITINEDNGGQIGNIGSDIVFGYDSAGEDFILAANPLSGNLDWNYQTFGAWETGRGTGSGTAGAISVGSATNGSNIPTSSSATYTGYYGGVFVDSVGADFISKGSVTATADFTNRSIAFQTSNDVYVSPLASTPTFISDSSQAMSGTLTYSSGTNDFSGTLTDGNNWSGAANGKFYGPAAEEMGGVFSLNGGGVQRHGGAFGAKR